MTSIVLLEADDRDAEKAALRMIEEGKWYDLGAGWRARADTPHTTGMQSHTHVYLRGSEAFAINRDGTASHNSDLSTMPNRVRDKLKDRKLIEAIEAEPDRVWVPAWLIKKVAEAVDHDWVVFRARQLLRKR